MKPATTPLRCLLVEDSEDDARLLLRKLREGGYAVTADRVDTAEAMQAALNHGTWDLVISDFNLPRFSGLAALELLHARGLDLPFIVVSGTIGEEVAVATMRAGAHDYVMKDNLARLVPAVARELGEAGKRRILGATEGILRLQSAALEAAANAIVITDREGTIQWVNAAFTALTGYPQAEALGRNPRDLVNCGRQNRDFYQHLWTTILTGQVWQGELLNRRKDGSIYLEEQTITPVRDPGGLITHFIAIKQDLTERKQAEVALQESERRYRLVFDQNPLPLWVYDDSTQAILAANQAALQQYGYSLPETLGLTFRDLHLPEDLPGTATRPGPAGSLETPARETRLRRKDGTVIHAELFSRPITFDGRPAQLAMAADITEKKIIQEKFLHAQRLESLGMLAAGIAHDLNNILTPIVFAAPLLRDSLTRPRDLKLLETLAQCAGRGTGLVKQILGFAGATSGQFQDLQLKHLLRDIVAVIEETFPKSIRLDHEIPTDLWAVHGDATQLHQVLLNLCVNARDAMPQGGTLRLSASNRRLDALEAAAIPGASPGAWIMLEVADTGTGIPADVLEHIWEPFFTTKAPGKGTGLGLSTVRGIVATHHGFVTVDTASDHGTTFRIYFPVAEAEGESSQSRSPLDIPEGHGEPILVVDDDPAIRYITTEILTTHGYRAMSSADGSEAIALFNLRPDDIALVVTDVDMPRLGGTALVETLRSIRPAVRVLAMSGMSPADDPGSDVAAIQPLVQGFLLKPFKEATLLETVHHLLHPPGSPTPTVS